MRNLCWPVLAALVVCGCTTEEASRKKNLRESTLGGPSVLSQPNVAELSAANAAWSEKTRNDDQWRAAVRPCLPLLIGLDTMITPPGGGADFSVESRLREMGVTAGPDRTLVDGRGKTVYVAVAAPNEEGTIEIERIVPRTDQVLRSAYPGRSVNALARSGRTSFPEPFL